MLPDWLRGLAASGRDALRLFFPERCVVCGRRLTGTERCLCLPCFQSLPFTRLHGEQGNVVERLFWGKIPIERANAYLHYYAGTDSRNLFWSLKYYNRPQVGRYMGRAMAADLLDSDFFDGVDFLLPLPLSRRRQRRRGYNQSEELARGVSAVTGLPVDTTSVVRTVDNPTQTRLNARERQTNVQGIFSLQHPEALAGHHVLLIDDIVTTGASLLSCGRVVASAGAVRISVLALALAGTHPHFPMGPRTPSRFPDGPEEPPVFLVG